MSNIKYIQPASGRRAGALITVLIFFSFFTLITALDPSRRVNQYLQHHWEIGDGLPANTISSLAQTPGGYLWIATSKGLVRFDGLTFTVVPFAGPPNDAKAKNTIPDALVVNASGVLQIGSSAGLTLYDDKTDTMSTLPFTHGITGDRVRRMKNDMKGALWISFISNSPVTFSNGTFTIFQQQNGLTAKKINGIVESQKGNLLLGDREKGIFTFKDNGFVKFPVNGLAPEAQIIHMLEDSAGDLWIAANRGLLRVTPEKTITYTVKNGLSNNYVTYLAEDSDHNLWVGTVKGLNRIQKEKDGTAYIEKTLETYTISSIFEDKEKSLWLGTYDSGLLRLTDGKFSTYALPQKNELLFSLHRNARGHTWIGTLGGKLYRMVNHQPTEFARVPGGGIAILSILQANNGHLWLGTNGQGVFKLTVTNPDSDAPTPGTFTQYTTTQGLADNTVTSIFQDSKNQLWFATFDGVSVMDLQKETFQSQKPKDEGAGKRVHNVYETNDKNIWIATDKGVAILPNGQPNSQNNTRLLQDTSVTHLHQDTNTNTIWLATHGAGLKRLKDGKITSFTTDHGLTSNFIYQFFTDSGDHFWIMSDSGILRVNKQDLNRLADNGFQPGVAVNCRAFGPADGMKSIDFENKYSRHSAAKTADGKFLFITKRDITQLAPEKMRINKVPPPVRIETVEIDGKTIPHRQPNHIHKFKDVSACRFTFTAPTFLSPENVKFKYKLDGRDKHWNYLTAGNPRESVYRNLEPGTYTYRVIACNSEGIWNDTGDNYAFDLTVAFYRTTMFKIVVALLILLIAAGVLHLYRKNQQQEMVISEKEEAEAAERERKEKAAKEKYKGTHVDPSFAEECIKKLKTLMEEEKRYREPDMSLQTLADTLNITPHQLSRILNENLNRSFSDYINTYRVEEAKEIFKAPGGHKMKVEAVAYEVGFNTMVAFYNAFKKYTDITPAQFKKQQKPS